MKDDENNKKNLFLAKKRIRKRKLKIIFLDKIDIIISIYQINAWYKFHI